MAKKKKDPTVIVRKKKTTIPRELSDGDKFTILDRYSRGITGITELAKEYNMKRVTMEKFISNHYKSMAMTTETNALMTAQKLDDNNDFKGVYVKPRISYKPPAMINEKFLKLLSDDEDDNILNEAEQVYVTIYARTGNNNRAIKQAGLDAGLKTSERIQNVVDNNLMLRGFYLRNRPKIHTAIKDIQDSVLRELNINKDYVQTNLVQGIEELKEEVVDNPRARTHLLRSIELLGKTIGAFTENIRIEEVDPANALDAILDMAKNEIGTYETADSG